MESIRKATEGKINLWVYDDNGNGGLYDVANSWDELTEKVAAVNMNLSGFVSKLTYEQVNLYGKRYYAAVMAGKMIASNDERNADRIRHDWRA